MSEEEKPEDVEFCPPCAADATVELGKDICNITGGEDTEKCGQIISAIEGRREDLTVKNVMDYTDELKGLAQKYDDKAGVDAMDAIQEVVKELKEGKGTKE